VGEYNVQSIHREKKCALYSGKLVQDNHTYIF